jgi:hypothetical protein
MDYKKRTESDMGHIRMDSTRRYNCAHLIAQFHHLSGKSSQSISAMLNFLYSNHIRESRFGFYILGTLAFKKSDYPHHYSIQLIDGARGLL